MTIDEAISCWLKAAGDNEAATKWQGITNVLKQRCIKQAVEYKQLAEWLTDYKELKNSIGVVKLNNEVKDALINKLDELAKETNDDPCDFNAGISYAVAEIWSLINEMDVEDIIK